MDSRLHIYVDVDDTLIQKSAGRDEPIPTVVEHVRQLHAEKAILYCWSTGGADHARDVCRDLGIEQCFEKFLHKPQVFIDDERAEEWPHFVHVTPDKLGSLSAYAAAVKEKRDREKQ